MPEMDWELDCYSKLILFLQLLPEKTSESLAARAEVLRINHLYQGIKNKLQTIENILKKLDFDFSQTIYMGDDLNDLPVLEKVDISICLPDSPQELKNMCSYVSNNKGGKGAVRESIEYVLKKDGKYQSAVQKFIQHLQNL